MTDRYRPHSHGAQISRFASRRKRHEIGCVLGMKIDFPRKHVFLLDISLLYIGHFERNANLPLPSSMWRF